MHSVFLYHAIKNGMRLGSVNPSVLEIYDDIPIELLEYVEDVILDRREDATERLLEYAENINNSASKEEKKDISVCTCCTGVNFSYAYMDRKNKEKC